MINLEDYELKKIYVDNVFSHYGLVPKKPSKSWGHEKLDEILDDFYDGDIRQSDMGKAKQAVLGWHNKQNDRLFQILIDEIGYEKAAAYKGER